MIKVSFIAIVLAAIGYKEYNPSVVGKWEHSKYPYYLEFFEDESYSVSAYIKIKGSLQEIKDSGTYLLNRDSLVLNSLESNSSFRSLIQRQNKRKLILINDENKLVYKRLK